MFKIDDKIITYFKILLILPVMMALAQLPGYVQWIIIIGAIVIFVYPKIMKTDKGSKQKAKENHGTAKEK